MDTRQSSSVVWLLTLDSVMNEKIQTMGIIIRNIDARKSNLTPNGKQKWNRTCSKISHKICKMSIHVT